MPRVSMFFVMAGILVLALPSFQSQDPQPPGSSTPPHSSSQAPSSPPRQESSDANRRIHDSVEDLLSSDPVLSGADVIVTVDDKNLTLTGTVDSYAQHQRVLQLVAQYGRWRNIVDQIK